MQRPDSSERCIFFCEGGRRTFARTQRAGESPVSTSSRSNPANSVRRSKQSFQGVEPGPADIVDPFGREAAYIQFPANHALTAGPEIDGRRRQPATADQFSFLVAGSDHGSFPAGDGVIGVGRRNGFWMTVGVLCLSG